MSAVHDWLYRMGMVLVSMPGLLAGTALANDVAFGGAGADLVPLTEERVRMVSEDILLERTAPRGYRILGEGDWRVEASYRFRNLTDGPVAVQIGFPEPTCDFYGDCNFEGFEAMTTLVRGEPVALTMGELQSGHDWAERIDRVHLFQVKFAPHETVEVVHRYRHGLTVHAGGGEGLLYLTRTGAPWAGTIESARFRIRLPFRPWGMGLGEWASHLGGFSAQRVDGQTQVELVFQRQDWEPAHDLELYLGPGRPTLETPALIDGCPSHGELFELEMDAEAVDIDTLRERTASLDDTELRLCRNAIFAHHGMDFQDPALDRFFYGDEGLRIHEFAERPWLGGAVFARSEGFSPGVLSEAERAYVRAIQWVEQDR